MKIRKPIFPPKKRRIDLGEYLRDARSACINPLQHPAWFEDANHFYFADFDQRGTRLILAQEKDVYYRSCTFGEILPKPGSAALFRPNAKEEHLTYLTLFDANFDARFIYGQNLPGVIRFGNYRDGNLGKIFFLTEPKDAKDILITFRELGGRLEWLDGANGIKYFYHNPESYQLTLVAPIGTRFLEDKGIAIVYQNKSISDREFYQGLFEEELKEFAGIQVEKTYFKVEVPPPTPEEIAEQERREAEKAAQREQVAQAITETKALLNDRLKDVMAEFGIKLELKLGSELRMIGNREVVYFHFHPIDQPEKHFFYHSIDSESFLRLSPETNADSIEGEVLRFLDRYREKFHAFKRIYDANISYHNLVNPSSRPPELDYRFIFDNL